MRLQWIFGRLAAALLLLAVPFSAPEAAETVDGQTAALEEKVLQAGTLEEKVREHTFANGLKLLVVERPSAPIFTAYLTVGVGGVDEASSMRGMAHFLEHLRFKGTRTIGTTDFAKEKPLLDSIEEAGEALDRMRLRKDADPAQIAELEKRLDELQERHRRFVIKDEFAGIYARHGGVGYNAFTSKDLTSYLISLPANKLELWAAIESDRMKNAVLREFYTERDVVMEERRRSYDTNPDGLLYENLIATAFTVHPYRNPVIGWPSDIANLTPDEAHWFMENYYMPTNTVIAIVGAVDFDKVVSVVGKYFGDIPPGTSVPEVTAVEPPQRGEKRIHVRFDSEPKLAMAFHKPTLPERADYVFDVIDQLLAQGRTSRLYQSLVIDKQLATSVSAYGAPGFRYPNLFVINAVPRHPHTTGEVEAAITEELQKLAEEPVTEEELARVRNRLQVERLRLLKSNDGLAGQLTFYESVAGDWRYLVDYDKQIATVTPSEIMQVARRYLTPANRTVATVGNQEG
ncbi:MAG: pitrilysin family protein [Syntrophotaleaceae bacterium]